MTYVSKSLSRAQASSSVSWNNNLRLKETGFLSSQLASDNIGSLGAAFRGQALNRKRYSLFRGWLYSAINALATEAGGQDVEAFQATGASSDSVRRVLNRVKGNPNLLSKGERSEIEALPLEDPLVRLLDKPNPIQYRFQFVYSFVANLLLTGWSYVVLDEGPDGTEVYCLPTTWITPIHEKGPFSEFKVKDPQDPGSEGVTLDREQVAFVQLPNPSNILGAIAPATSQETAINIDNKIQDSQETYFDQGIFPSALITIGKNPHPEGTGGGGTRPRLSRQQRSQIHAVIRRVMQGVHNFGNPAIIDGLIERIDRLSMSGTEMGWDKSEEKVKTRILSAFGLHSFVLGENMPGSYAQAYIIDERTCRKINVYLNLLSSLMTDLVGEGRHVYWKPCTPHDPTIEIRYWQLAIDAGWVNQDEYRAEKLGLPPMEGSRGGNALTGRATALTSIIKLLELVGRGVVGSETAANILSMVLDLPLDTITNLISDTAATNGSVAPPPEQPLDELQRAMRLMRRWEHAQAT